MTVEGDKGRKCFLCDLSLNLNHVCNAYEHKNPKRSIEEIWKFCNNLWKSSHIQIFCCDCFNHIITTLFDKCRIIPYHEISEVCRETYRIVCFSECLDGIHYSRRYEFDVKKERLESILEAMFG